MNEPILRAARASAGYGGPDVIRGIDVELVRGAPPQGIVGPSGAGKTTVVDVLLGKVRPTAGHVTFEGRTVGKMSRRDKKAFGARVRSVAQNGMPGIDPRWTVKRMVNGALSDARKAGRASGRSPEELLGDVALEPRYLERTVHSLSGGERQRLAMALALTTRPDALLLDEPLTAVDPAMRGEVARTLQHTIEELGTAVLLVSHDLELVQRLCPTVHVMVDGEFVAHGPLRQVLATSEHPVIRDMAAAAPLAVQRFR